MRTLTFFLSIILISLFFSAKTIAVPTGEELTFQDSTMGPVIFKGTSHAEKVEQCNDCHPKLFKMEHGAAQIIFADHIGGENFCFACHNDTVAFKSMGNCLRCHKGGETNSGTTDTQTTYKNSKE